jgi:hypothetical protein
VARGTASSATGIALGASTRADEAELLKEQLAEDEGFTEILTDLAGSGADGVAILAALEKEIDTLTVPLVGTTYADTDAARTAIDAAAPVKNQTKWGKWSYLESIGVTPPSAMKCVAGFEATIMPDLGSLLFMSESDRPFDVVAFAGQGAQAPTASSVLALVNAPSSYTAQVRATDNYYAAFEADDVATAAVKAWFEQNLTDVTYVAVLGNGALVDVYLVGRTSCGDLVGLHSISVET